MHNLAIQEQLADDGEQRITFSATGSEYFRIWIVNLLLTIVTFGIYSAWAKVRRSQYFYASTQLAGSSFEYHGNALAILKGRILAVLLFGAYNLAFQANPVAALIAFAVMAVVMPLMIWKSMQFKLHNSSYRGIRFGFNGSKGGAYLHFLLWPMLFATLVFGPLAHQRVKRYQVAQSRYGSQNFGFNAPVSGFYKVWGGLFALYLALVLGLAFAAAGLIKVLGPLAITLLPLALLFIMMLLAPVVFCLLQNLVWNHITIGEHEFRSDMKIGRTLWIHFSNLAGLVLTLGLFTPFAQVRWTKYRLESLGVIVNGSLDQFVAAEAEQQAATGESVAEIFDLDIAL